MAPRRLKLVVGGRVRSKFDTTRDPPKSHPRVGEGELEKLLKTRCPLRSKDPTLFQFRMLEISNVVFVLGCRRAFNLHGDESPFSHVAKELEERMSARWNRPFRDN